MSATLALLSGAALGVGAPAGSTISNTAYLDLSDGVTTTTQSTTPVVINVQQVYSVSITPDGTTGAPGQTVTVQPGTSGVLTYSVTNTGNGSDAITLSAAAANAAASGAQIQGIYVDTNGNGTYDAGTDTATTSLTGLAADASRTVFVVYNVPAAAASGATPQLNLSGTSAGDATKTDTNNVGQFTVGRLIDVSMTLTASKTVTAGATQTFTDVLTNTGNTTLTAAEVLYNVTRAATNGGSAITDAFTVSYTVVGPAGSFTNTSLKAASDAAIGAGGLTAGAALTITVSVTAATTAADADRLTLSFQGYSGVATSSPSVVNNAPAGDPQASPVNTTTVQRGIGAVTKTVAFCGATYASCPTTGGAGPVNARPGEYVIYFLSATNTGTGTLYNVRLRDALPANFVVTHVGAVTTEPSSTIVFSKTGAATTWNTDVTAIGALNAGTDTLWASVNTAAPATTIDGSDVLSAGRTLRLSIAGYVRAAAAAPSTPVRDDTKLP